MKKKESGCIGASFDAFLEEERLLNECKARAVQEIHTMLVSSPAAAADKRFYTKRKLRKRRP